MKLLLESFSLHPFVKKKRSNINGGLRVRVAAYIRYEKSRYCSRFNWPTIAWLSIGTEQKRGGPDLIELNAPPDATVRREGKRALINKV